MQPRIITAKLRIAGTSQKEIAARFGYTRKTGWAVINRINRNPKIEQAIAEALNEPIWEIFPEWYEPPQSYTLA